ncbi:Undecaprenyl-phosphate 4-deoxy-4-formamido-L-arabinose transferase (plasmid) [Roseobacter fucihabitans]|uniref:Undecaprenyl-phosphate 4-deoxy-4-formamido-L-arabinose transferase n=1 Tax=Roseobacter fucihabitans TaxID=1537242 RepID=A0ABZ2BZG6_9RHOB|nr:glycosyltransferase [Roseobacter litoralis]MBC6966901.1 Phenylacetate-coenzyme A ligase [Roseobacter litoralis]
MTSPITLSVIAPCYNEEDNINALVQRVLAVFDKIGVAGELIAVNDCSTDETGPLLDKAAEQDARVRPQHHTVNGGIFKGWHTGLEAAQGHYVCLIDSDLQNPPEEIERLYRKIEADSVDIAQAVRSSIGRLKDNRWFLSRGLNTTLNLCFGMKAQDNKSGFLIAPRDVLKDVLDYKYIYRYPHTFVRVSAEHKSYTVREVETLFMDRVGGQSFLGNFPWRVIGAVSIDMIKAFKEFGFFTKENDLSRFVKDKELLAQPEKSSPFSRFVRELYFLTFPLHTWMISRRVRALYFALRKSQYLKREDLDAYRLMKLQRIVRHAYGQVPYYRRRMQEMGVRPSDIQSLEDIAKLPLLSKDDVRQNLHFDMFADNHQKREMLRVSTSGSTGAPFVIYADKKQLELRAATTLRAMEWAGWSFGDRQARLWHQTIGMTWQQAFKEKLNTLLMRRIFIPAYELRDQNIRNFVERIRKHNPVLVDGYAESFNFLAQFGKENKIEGFKPKAIMTSAQIMPPQTRAIIEKQFGAQVFDKYGSREFSGIAYEDSGHDGHVVCAESYIVEILKDGVPAKPGEVGEIVVTDLNNAHMPVLRYRIGDLAEKIDDSGRSASGRDFPRIGRIEGRTQAIVVCPNGTWLPGTFFAHYFKDFDQVVAQYQVVQDAPERLVIKVVPGLNYSEKMIKTVVDGLKEFTGPLMEITEELVDEIPLGRTGKRTGVVSTLGRDFQSITERIRKMDSKQQAEEK